MIKKLNEILKKFNTKLNKKLAITIVALFQAVLILVVGTYSWLHISNQAQTGTESYFSLNADAGIKINFEDGQSDNEIILSGNLWQGSSVDGRNIYFPTVGTKNTTATDINNIRFRAGNSSDVNSKYIVRDFTMWADVGEVDVWINAAESSVTYSSTGQPASAVRVAFYENNGEDPIVFAPEKRTESTQGVKTIDRKGVATALEAQTLKTFSDFGTEGDGPIFHLGRSEIKKITMIVWLEGNDVRCTNDLARNKDINLKINFGTTIPDATRYYFVDQTETKWIYDNYTNDWNLQIEDANDSSVKYNMVYAGNNKWVVTVPGSLKNIKFVSTYNENSVTWLAGEDTWLDTNKKEGTFIAVGSTGTNGTQGLGHWDGDPMAETVTVYVSMSYSGWGLDANDYGIYPKIYFWPNNYNNKTYPGYGMTYVETNGFNEKIYKYSVPKGVGGFTICKGDDNDSNNSSLEELYKFDVSGAHFNDLINGGDNIFYPTGITDSYDRSKYAP